MSQTVDTTQNVELLEQLTSVGDAKQNAPKWSKSTWVRIGLLVVGLVALVAQMVFVIPALANFAAEVGVPLWFAVVLAG